MSPRKPPDVDALVSRHWPYDGPYTPDLLLAAAAMLPELVRYINNATLNAGAATLPAPNVAASLAGYIQQTVANLQQTVNQLDASHGRWNASGNLVAIGTLPPSDVLTLVSDVHLADAEGALANLTAAMSRVHSLLGRLYLKEVH